MKTHITTNIYQQSYSMGKKCEKWIKIYKKKNEMFFKSNKKLKKNFLSRGRLEMNKEGVKCGK